MADAGDQLIVRVNTGALPLLTMSGEPFDLLAAVTTLKRVGVAKSWAVQVVADGDSAQPSRTVAGRVCAVRKSAAAPRSWSGIGFAGRSSWCSSGSSRWPRWGICRNTTTTAPKHGCTANCRSRCWSRSCSAMPAPFPLGDTTSERKLANAGFPPLSGRCARPAPWRRQRPPSAWREFIVVGGLTTNGVHASLLFGLSNSPGRHHPEGAAS